MTPTDDAIPAQPAVPRGATASRQAGNRGVVGNERLTALAGAALLALLAVEVVTSIRLRTLLSAHVVVGVVLAGPLAVKLGGTGYRFVRYYTRSPSYVRRGPPHLALRVLGPLLVATALVVVGSGIGLMVTGPRNAGLLLPLHGFSVLVFFPLMAIHLVAHLLATPRLVADEWSSVSAALAPGRGIRMGVTLGALMLGVLGAMLLLPTTTPWIAWSQTNGQVPAPVIVGTLLAIVALLATRPLRWK
ncbi:MAG TPA: hypothetical protein VIC85_13090 [Ktedonobacterales bacterium]